MKCLWVALLFAVASVTFAAPPATPEAAHLAELAKKLGVPVEALVPSPVSGLYEVRHDHEFGYVTANGQYLIQGDLIDLDSGEEITEEHRRADRLEALRTLPDDQYIQYSPAPPLRTKYVVTVFTDVDCPFCRMMHKQMANYNEAGIAIRYAFFPRSGPDTPSFAKAEAVWCSKDRRQALTLAKEDKRIGSDISCSNPVAAQYQLGQDLGLRGTPMLILPNGARVDGYRSPQMLTKMLQAMGKNHSLKISLDH